jgi:hypothetical protein
MRPASFVVMYGYTAPCLQIHVNFCSITGNIRYMNTVFTCCEVPHALNFFVSWDSFTVWQIRCNTQHSITFIELYNKSVLHSNATDRPYRNNEQKTWTLILFPVTYGGGKIKVSPVPKHYVMKVCNGYRRAAEEDIQIWLITNRLHIVASFLRSL